MKRFLFLTGACAVQVLVLAGVALAHVEVSPDRVSAGGTQQFVAEVPNESDVPYTGLEIRVPEGFEVVSVESPGGFEGQVRGGSIVWSGGSVPAGESAEFAFRARVPERAGEFALEAIQTYGDGEVVEWTGAPGSNEPAPVVSVSAEGAGPGEAGDPQHGNPGHGGHSHGTARTMPVTGGVSVGVVALGGALLAAGMLLRSRHGR